MPALQAVREIRTVRVHVEVATWQGAGRFPGTNLPWCHYLAADDYRAVQTPSTTSGLAALRR